MSGKKRMEQSDHVTASLMLEQAHGKLRELLEFMAGKVKIPDQGAVVAVMNRVEALREKMMIIATREYGYDYAEATYKPRSRVGW